MHLRARLSLGFLFVALAGAGVAVHVARLEYERAVPHGASAAAGVSVDGFAIPPGADARAFVAGVANRELDTPIDVRYDGDTLFTASPRELGARADVDAVVIRALRVARTGDPLDRYEEAADVAENGFALELPIDLGADVLAARLVDPKEELDERPSAAKRHIGTGVVEPHADGRFIDAFAGAEAILRAMREGRTSVDLDPYLVHPRATADAVRDVDVAVVLSKFETRFGGPPGRDQNIYRATGSIDGVVLMPNDEMSYNDLVGPRSIENGFNYAPEIYKGEMREGVGGGACQVASTLHAAAFFAGLEIVERRNHSHPIGYVPVGLDATVSYPVLDLKIRNPYPFAVVIHGEADKGKLEFEVLGHERPVEVNLATETAGISNYTRKIEKSGFLAEGAMVVKQKGKNGMRVKRTKTIRDKTGQARVEESMDVFPPMQEILIVGPKFDESTLPPLPSVAG